MMMTVMSDNDLHEVVTDVYLGNIVAATHLKRRKQLGITHLLTVMDRPLEADSVADVIYRCVVAMDQETFSLLPHFDECADFIANALTVKGRVLVHCFAGQSRGAAALAAYLVSHKGKTVEEALELIQTARPEAGPNKAFMRQLALYQEMGGRLNILHPSYRRYQLELFGEQVQSMGRVLCVPRHLLSSAEGAQATTAHTFYKCRKCRTKLFTSESLMTHEEGEGDQAFDWRNKVPKNEKSSRRGTGQQCQRSLFVQPQAWMSDHIMEIQGKLHCPGKCHGKVGSYVWFGERCPCGAWVAPAFHIQTSKVDAQASPLLRPQYPLSPSPLPKRTGKPAQAASAAAKDTPSTATEGNKEQVEVCAEVQSLSLK